MQAYSVGDTDTRPWGSYIVTAVATNAAGEDVCEKDIAVNPQQILSLQSHKMRRENWRVVSGTLTVIVDGAMLDLRAGQSIDIPQGAVHCMANLSAAPVTVHEIQQGTCREDDIIRYLDAYGRATAPSEDTRVKASIAAYQGLLERIQKA